MGITPLELQQQEFNTVFRGYDPKEVEHILSVASRELETVMRQLNELRDANAQQQRHLENLSQREEELKRTLLMTQQVAHDIKVGARKEADLIMGRAELEAERLLDQSHERLTNLLTDISNLKRQRSQLEAQLKSVLDTHYAMLPEKESSSARPANQLKVVRDMQESSAEIEHRFIAAVE
jgi:cell division initiation protein